MHAHTRTHMRAHEHACTGASRGAHTHTHGHAHTHTCTRTQKHACTQAQAEALAPWLRLPVFSGDAPPSLPSSAAYGTLVAECRMLSGAIAPEGDNGDGDGAMGNARWATGDGQLWG